MAFSEKIKTEAKRRAAFRCCICHKSFVEVHHIIPLAESGSDDLSNAAPLCARCHDLYGGNPEKRKAIRQMRDSWWSLMAERANYLGSELSGLELAEIEPDEHFENALRKEFVYIYHVVFEDENFEESAQIIHQLIFSSQKNKPNYNRKLFLDIQGHKLENGDFDQDMFELQTHFLLGFMSEYLSELHVPLISLKNPKVQNNRIPDKINIYDNSIDDALKTAIDDGSDALWLADKNKLIKF